MNLAELPDDHPLRNTPLGRLNAEYLPLYTKGWRPVKPIVISRATYNALSGPWISLNEWRVLVIGCEEAPTPEEPLA